MNKPLEYDNNKITIVGCGRVGMTAAYTILQQGLANELILFGRSKEKLIGEELDLEHGISFMSSATVRAADDYQETKNSDVVIFSAGAAQEPGETRLDLAKKNVKIMESIIPKIVKQSPEAIIIMIANPVDILTYKAYQLAGLPKGRIFGSGTTLDTSRFRFHLAEFLQVNPRSIHAYILGEHGDSSFPVISSATIGGQSIATFENFSQQKAIKAFKKAKNAAYKIIESKGATYYAIASVIGRLIETVLRDARTILPVSVPLHGFYDHYGISLSVPCVIGRNGAEGVVNIKLSWEEKQALDKSVETLKQYL